LLSLNDDQPIRLHDSDDNVNTDGASWLQTNLVQPTKQVGPQHRGSTGSQSVTPSN